MAIIDFQEIPEAGLASGKQDSFELFAREVLEHLGFRILQGPSRGADLGKDLLIEETRPGLTGDTRVKWLVSCKHFAFSGKSVRPDDEKNVLERVNAAGCNGFLGFYSTIASSGLSELMHRQPSIGIKFFDRDEIERHLLSSSKGRALIGRYFPVSAKKVKHVPATLFSDVPRIACDNCGKDLLDPPSGIWVIWHIRDEITGEDPVDHFVDFHFACKGKCDWAMKSLIRARHASIGFVYDGWDDIPDLTVPTVFITKSLILE